MLDLLDAGLPAPATGLFTTRAGGTSLAPWCSLDLAHHVGDDVDRVTANRGLLSAALGLTDMDVAYMSQPHSNCVGVVDRPNSQALAYGVPGVDALVTRTRGVGLAVLAADCLPVLFADPVAGVVAVAHAGRRGLVDGVLQAVLRVMVEQGADAARTTATIGPAVCDRCYELPQALVDEVAAAIPGSTSQTAAGTPSVTLGGAARSILERAGVRVLDVGLCTVEQPDRFYSYRRDGVTGRHAGVVVLR